MAEPTTKCGYIAILGSPNVGKSTLLNQFIGLKVSIVSPKVQTTRARILGICIQDNSQLIFVDTPGIFLPQRRIERAMVAAAWREAWNADHIILLADVTRGMDDNTCSILNRLKAENGSVDLILNKIDLIDKPRLLGLANDFNRTGIFDQIFMISAERGDGVREILKHLVTKLKDGPWLFPKDQVSDMPLRLLAAEVTREKVYLQLHKELPYSATVETETWKEQEDGSTKIEQVIYVQRNSQKAIVLGKNGSRIKSIGSDARQNLEEILGHRVHLFIFVKVKENWDEAPARYRDLGLDFNA